MAAEISGMDDAGYCLSVRADLEVFHFGLGNQSMNRDYPAAGLLTGKICRERQGVAPPLRDDRLAIGRGFAQDAVGVGNQEGASEANGPEAELIAAGASQLARRFLDGGGIEKRYLPLARDGGN